MMYSTGQNNWEVDPSITVHGAYYHEEYGGLCLYFFAAGMLEQVSFTTV